MSNIKLKEVVITEEKWLQAEAQIEELKKKLENRLIIKHERQEKYQYYGRTITYDTSWFEYFGDRFSIRYLLSRLEEERKRLINLEETEKKIEILKGVINKLENRSLLARVFNRKIKE
jgi:hypothetical protein